MCAPPSQAKTVNNKKVSSLASKDATVPSAQQRAGASELSGSISKVIFGLTTA